MARSPAWRAIHDESRSSRVDNGLLDRRIRRSTTRTPWLASARSTPTTRASPALLERFVRESNVRGIRSIPAKSGRLDDPGVDVLWATAERLGIVMNVLVNRDKADELEALGRRHRSLRVVIDHGLNLKAGDGLEPTLRDLERLARLPNLHAKLTFIPTGMPEAYPAATWSSPAAASSPRSARIAASGGATSPASCGARR